MEFLSKNLERTAEIANEFVKNLKSQNNSATIVGLYGELGSGKTTFMKYLAKALGVEEEIKSPTFVIMKRYEIRSTKYEVRKDLENLKLETRNSFFDFLIHIDAYRIEKNEEMLNLGWQEIIADPQNLVCIEWPKLIEGIMPPHTKIFFEHGGDENERKIKIESPVVS